MVKLSDSAQTQYLDLIEHFLDRGYDQAAEKLTGALDRARTRIDENKLTGRDYPAAYPQLRWPNVKWTKVHRYWFAHTLADDPVIFNILWDAADIPARAVRPADSQ